MKIELNTGLKANALQSIQSTLEKLETKTESAPILGKKSVTVSTQTGNIDKLVAKLNLDTAETRLSTSKNMTDSMFHTVIANALRNINATEENMAVLSEVSELNDELGNVNSQITSKEQEIAKLIDQQKQAQDAVKKLQDQANSISKEIADLEAKIAAETNLTKKAKLEAELKSKNAELSAVNSKIATAQEKVSGINKLLDTVSSQLTALNKTKDLLTKKIKDKLKELIDIESNREKIESSKEAAKDLPKVDDEKAERSEEEEKYFEEHNPLRIIQDAILAHDEELLDDIISKREDKI